MEQEKEQDLTNNYLYSKNIQLPKGNSKYRDYSNKFNKFQSR